MFKKNPNQGQISIMDPCLNYPKYVQEALQKSWAPYFYQHIINNINEERFSVLFSENHSRPNAPANIIVGLLFLKWASPTTQIKSIVYSKRAVSPL